MAVRPSLAAYLFVVMAGAALAFAAAWSAPGSADPFTFAFLAAFAAAAQARPLHLSPKMKINVDDTPLFAAALLFGPAHAMALAALATLASRPFVRGEPWFGHAFNLATVVLGMGCASVVHSSLARGTLLSSPDPLAIWAAGATLYVVRTALVDIVVALHLRRDPRANWWHLHARAFVQQLALYVLGAVAALAIAREPLAVALFVAPVALVYLSLRQIARLRARTRAAIFELADLLDQRDPYTYGHSQRVAEYAERVARHMRLSPAQIDLIREAGRLHDLGKIGTPPEVLRKPVALAGHELVSMRAHPEYGAQILRRLPEFWEGAALVAAHHERVDGAGYPRGLRGDEIPIEVGIIAVADAYDAMATDRPYRPALGWARIRAELEAGRGTQWHAAVVDAFIAVMEPVASRDVPAAAAAG